MSLHATAPSTSRTGSGRSSRRRRPAFRAAAALVAGGTLAATLGLAAPAVASVTTTVDWSSGRGGWGWGSSGSSPGGSAGSVQQTTVASDPATSAESRAVALVDTVLPDGEAAGTGIVLTSDGEVLTNYHVVEGSTSVRVTIAATGKAYTATVVGADQSADVALLQLKGASGLTVAKIDDDTLKVGDDVTAIGNAGGTGTLTAADGDVTDLASAITTASEDAVAGERLTKMIETDADVVPGDSGGPLVDAEGEVVGIDTAASSGREIDGYAIPIATALAVVSDIRDGDASAAVRIGPAAFLGVQVASVATADAGYGTSASGATVAGVLDGDAADRAGIAAGDTITKVGSSAVSSAAGLTKALGAYAPGDRVKVTWTTVDGGTASATVTLGSSPVN